MADRPSHWPSSSCYGSRRRWHGIGIALVAMGGAALLINKPFSGASPKHLFRGVETELLMFLAATAVIADGIMLSRSKPVDGGATHGLLFRKKRDRFHSFCHHLHDWYLCPFTSR